MVNAEQFDISGVKLGMTQAQAIAAVTDNMHVDSSAISFDPFPQPSVVTKQKEPTYFEVRHGATALRVHLKPQVPFNPEQTLVVSRISYQQPWAQQTAVQMKQQALQKYGEPSNGRDSGFLQWCRQPLDKNVGCHDFFGPKLELTGTELTLSDPQYREAINRYRRQRTAS
ncbi:hypothetical protein HR45_08830 [Shewanella mangrovi]|uniref:Uncharacterized protein n=2 Tax=Shewanella mangrovi TaxID=1515746 RepID=A0A094JZW6_9GAMM|nr:hypothetical protein HR45_08830 [Shewanella mangrovi]